MKKTLIKSVLATLLTAFSFNAYACDKEYTKEYYEENSHLYFRVTGQCGRYTVTYVMHAEECECGEGLYEVKAVQN